MRFFLIAFLLLSTTTSIYAQTENRPWFFGLGINAVDYQTSQKSGINTEFSAFRISAGRLLFNHLSAEVSYAQNTITELPGLQGLELSHSAVDFMLWYSFRSIIYRSDNGLIDPYLGAGAGVTWLENREQTEEIQSNTLNATAGINFWVSDQLAVVAQGSYKNSTDDFADTYIEYLLGIRYTFGLKGNDVCFP